MFPEHPVLKFAIFCLACEDVIELIRLKNSVFQYLGFLRNVGQKTLIAIGNLGVEWGINKRLPARRRKVFYKLQPALHPCAARWRPIIGEDQYAFYAFFGHLNGLISFTTAPTRSNKSSSDEAKETFSPMASKRVVRNASQLCFHLWAIPKLLVHN